MTTLEAETPRGASFAEEKEHALRAKEAGRARLSWYLYDFGNSAYASVVLLAVYSAYFKGTVVGGARGTWLWGLSIGIAMLFVAITSPILGAIADFAGAKKRFLGFFTVLSVIFTGMLFFVQKGDIFTGMFFFIMAEIGYRSAQVFYDAMLPELSTADNMGKVSGYGWAIGSSGGVLSLLIVLGLILKFPGPFTVRLAMVVAAVFFAAASVPLFLNVKEKAAPQKLPAGETYLSIASRRLGDTLRSASRFKEFMKFIAAFLIYNDGIIMLLDFAAIIGAVLFGMAQQQLIILMLIVQVASIGGAYVFGLMAHRFGSKQTLIVSILLMTVTVVWAALTQSLALFYVVGAAAGFALTGVQSVSRTAVGLMCPEGKSAEFYGMFAVAGRTSSFVGPTLYGWLAANAALWYTTLGQPHPLSEQSGQRAAMLSIVVFLLIGLVVLLFVKKSAFHPEGSPALQDATPGAQQG